MADKISDSIIDDILESAKKYSAEDVPSVSVDEIDTLLASLGISDVKKEPVSQKPKITPDFSERAEAVKTVSVKKEADILSETEKKITAFEQETVAEETEEEEIIPAQEIEKEEESEEEPEEVKSFEPKVKKEKKTSGFLELIKKANRYTEEGDEPYVEDTDENVSVSEDEDGQMELQVDGEEISSAPADVLEPEEAETPKTAPSVSGQISIEKTRMFNEVKVHGEYNPNISHNLGNMVTRTTTGEGEALSTPVMGEEKYRKHFMNKPVQSIEKTQEHRAIILSRPAKTMETPGIIVKKDKNASADSDGFEPMPTIIPVESEIQGDVYSHSEDVSDGQIMLEGFGEEEIIEKTTEEEAEAQLLEKRKEVVQEFIDRGLLFKQDVEEGETPEYITEGRKKRYERKKVRIKREYFGPKDADAVLEEYYHEKKKITVRLTVLAVMCGIMAVISAVAGMGNGNFDMFGGEESFYILFELVLLVICSFINADSFVSVIKNIKSLKPNIDLAIVISATVGILQTAISFAFADYVESSMHLFTAAAVVPMIFKAAGELIGCKNDLENFIIVSDKKDDCYTVENIDDEYAAAEIARGLMLGEPEIKYSAKTKFPSRFVELSREADVTPSILKYSVLGVSAVSLLVGLITLIMEKDVILGITAFSGALLMGIPASAGIISAVGLSHANRCLRKDGTVINGFSAVESAVNSNGIIIDSADAFKSGGCNIEGIKLYHKMRIDEAILYTASVVIASGGVLSEIFEGVIEGKKELLLPTETLAYEEKLGCSCWIHNHRVLVGNRELLHHHNVELPEDGLEEKYREAGKNTLYLAIEGKIAAMFIVVYKADSLTAHYIRTLEKDGVSILFRTSDANITESFLEREFGLPKNAVKIINPVAGEMFTKIKTEEKEQSGAYIIHDGRVVSMLKALHLSFGINQLVNVSKTVQTIASVVGVLLVACLSFVSGLSQIAAWQIILYQVILGAVLYLLPSIKNKRAR